MLALPFKRVQTLWEMQQLKSTGGQYHPEKIYLANPRMRQLKLQSL